MKEVRIGVIGLGNMGATHARSLTEAKVPHAVLGAICDADQGRLQNFTVPAFSEPGELIRSRAIDAVIIATPHFSHTTIGIEALEAGLHVLVEKPISAHKADAERLIAAHRDPKQIFAAMFNQRTDPFYRRLRDLVQQGELGKIRRINWIVTNWFRTNAYYRSGGWRATWAGEGGGVLLNQSPHNLDLWQWIFGMPRRVRAFCHLGHYHPIEVEDDVTAYFEYEDGATGVFITSTGEAPGTNRLEVMADRGRVVIENDKFNFVRNEIPADEFSSTATSGFAAPPTWNIEIPIVGHGGQHVEILQNFAAAILHGTPLVAPAAEGIHSVELANAILFSSLTERTLTLPIDSAAFEAVLQDKIRQSPSEQKQSTTEVAGDFAKSFAH
jgi:predicted dehydrogenase